MEQIFGGRMALSIPRFNMLIISSLMTVWTKT